MANRLCAQLPMEAMESMRAGVMQCRASQAQNGPNGQIGAKYQLFNQLGWPLHLDIRTAPPQLMQGCAALGGVGQPQLDDGAQHEAVRPLSNPAPANPAPANSKQPSGNSGSKSSAAYASRHQAAEQRRRSRINERLDLLRQMVPHTDRANTACFLEEVIKYIDELKSKCDTLEEQVAAGNQQQQQQLTSTLGAVSCDYAKAGTNGMAGEQSGAAAIWQQQQQQLMLQQHTRYDALLHQDQLAQHARQYRVVEQQQHTHMLQPVASVPTGMNELEIAMLLQQMQQEHVRSFRPSGEGHDSALVPAKKRIKTVQD